VRHSILRSYRKPILIGALVLFGAILVALGLLVHFWPFTEGRVSSELGATISAKVRFGTFHRQYFPPGCVAENVVFQRSGSNESFIMVPRLEINSNLVGLLRHHVSVIRAEGAHVRLSRGELSFSNSSQSKTVVDELTADDALVEIPSRKSDKKFPVHRFSVRNLGSGGVMDFSADLENPWPRGELRTTGSFGPWNNSQPEQTTVFGNYSLEQADMSVFSGLGGRLSSEGEFRGTFKNLDVRGSTDSPNFELTSTKHSLPLKTRFQAVVDATSGNVVLKDVKARLGKTDINGSGTLSRKPGQHRVALINLETEKGRIEDVFYLFVRNNSPLRGNVKFSMKVSLPGGQERFLKRVGLESKFTIQDAQFANPLTQEKVNKLSETPEQHADQNAVALAKLVGQVRVEHGVAHFSDLSLQDVGASAKFVGNYDLVDEKIDMHGRLRTRKDLSNGTHGIKAALMKVISQFFKKNPKETEAPVKISGTYHHPAFGLDLQQRKM
jgi:hypothetical protein